MNTTSSLVQASGSDGVWREALHPSISGSSAAMIADRESEVHVRIQSSADIVAARQQARALATRAGFSHSSLTIIATAVSEVARNIVEYAQEGEVIITLINDATNKGVEIVAADQGPGVADVATFMVDGYSTGTGLGLGLRGSRRLMDEFAIASEMGKGTTVTMKKWVVCSSAS
jgi:anti-sigma regulatory factor (Ser/Thr protein kinase)